MTTDTLRWRFEDASLHLPGTATQILLQTSSDTSVDSLYSALDQIDTVTSDRFLKLQDAALHQCQETDESDLHRLRKHFKTLKNTFTVYDLKEGFLDGLLQGLPDGSEEDQLYQFEEEMEKNSVLLRHYKASNEQAQAEVVKTMEELAQTRNEYTSQRDLCAAQLQELHHEQAQYEAEQSQMRPLSGVDYAAVQAECLASLQAESVVQNDSEAAYASQEASIQELAAEVESAADELRTLEAQVANMKQIRQSEAKDLEVNHRFVSHAEWCDAMVTTLEALSGVSVASVTGDRLELQLTTRVNPNHPPQTGVPCSTFHHSLLLRFDSMSGALQTVELQPEDVLTQHIGQATIAGQHGPAFVVRETQACLRQCLQRRVLLEEASKQFQLMPLETEDNVFQAQLLNSFRAEVHVPLEWPNGDGATLRSLWNGDTRVDLGDNFEQLGDTARDTDLSRGSLPAFLHAVAAAAVAACQ